MLRKELVQRSALRLLEKSSNNGVQRGELGIILSRHGVGKTACLVHMAVDSLLQGKHVVHISFSDRPDHIISWYEDIFSKMNLNNDREVYEEIVKNRFILHLSSRTDPNQIFSTLSLLISQIHFDVDLLIIDGYDFSLPQIESFLQKLSSLAHDSQVSVWMSFSFHREDLERDELGLPTVFSPYASFFALVLVLEPEKDHVRLSIKKDHDNSEQKLLSLELDQNTLLIKQMDN